MASDTHSTPNAARSFRAGEPNSQAAGSGNLSTTSSKLTSKLPRCQDYKPTALRWWYHGFLIICLATFLGLTEYAIQTLLANQQEGLESPLWSRSIEDHHEDRQSVSDYKELPHERLARGPSNASSSRAGAYTVNTGDFLALASSSSALAVTTDSVPSGPTGLHTLPSTELLLSNEQSTDLRSTVLASTSSTTPDPNPLTTDVLDATSQKIVSTGPSMTIGNMTSMMSRADAFLHLGPTTSTVSDPTPTVKTGDLIGGLEITAPCSPTPSLGAGDESNTDIPRLTCISGCIVGGDETLTVTMSDTGSYLHIGPTSSTTTAVVVPSTDGGYLSLGTTTAGMVNDKDPPPPSATTSRIISEATFSPDQEPSVTVIRQTEVWPLSKTTLEVTDLSGHIVVQTITADGPVQTSVLETTVAMRPGESLVAVPRIITTTRGGTTQIMPTTFVDSAGRTATSMYTTVVGVESVLATRTYFLVTSLPPGYTVLTVPTTVPTTEQGVVEVVQTVYTDAEGQETTSAYMTTLNGIPTTRILTFVIATPVSSGHKYVTLSTVIPTTVGGKTKVIKTTTRDARGQPTTFSYTTVESGTATSTTVWTIVTTPTSTSSSGSNGTQDTESVGVVVYGLGLRDYMLGAFLPTVLATIIAYPFKLININARLMQPFHELARAQGPCGVSAEASIFLRFYDWTGALSLPRSVRLGQPVIVLSDLLVLGAALLAPIAAETVSVHVPKGCNTGCYGSLGVTPIPGRVLEALMATMVALLIALIVLLNVVGWETGVSHNPWGIAGMATLGLSPGFRDRMREIPRNTRGSAKERLILEALTESTYALDEYWISSSRGSDGVRGYGIVVKTSNNAANKPVKINRRGDKGKYDEKPQKKRSTQPFALLTWWGRGILLFTFACVLIIATYYETTSLDSGFERFMDSRGFGIRFFFTALGVVIGGCMETFFRSVAVILPYQLLSTQALPAGQSILLSPPTNAFYGVFSAFRQRSIFLGAVSFTTILAELLLPVTLSHIPFSHLDTYETQLVCAWLSISILASMMLVILYSFLIRWPHMPVDPRTIAGAMFYVCDSWMLGAMDGAATLGKKQRDSFIYSQRLNYEYKISEGVSGKARMNVDFCGDAGEAAQGCGDLR